MHTFINILGIIYGIVLILAAFVRIKVIESMRLDALFLPHPTDSTRPVNLVFGLLVAGYASYSLFIR